MYLVRFLNSCVMVRVGGGWETLPKFLESNDPCRGSLWRLSLLKTYIAVVLCTVYILLMDC